MLKIAGIQMNGTPDKEKNLEKAGVLIGLAAESGAKMICLQQLFTTYDLQKVMVAQEEVSLQPIDPEARDRPRRATARVRTIVTLGPRSPFPGRVPNTWFLTCIKRDGRWLVSQAQVQLEEGAEESITSLLERLTGRQ